MANVDAKERMIVYSSVPESLCSYLKRLWNYRFLILVLASRELKIQYSQMFLGVAWAVLQPLIAILIYSFFFDVLIGINTNGMPYILFVVPGIMGWFYFTKIVAEGGAAFQTHQDLIKKMEFPKLILPLAKCLYSLHQLLINLVILFIVLAFYGQWPSWQIIFLPLVILLNTVLAFSGALWINILSVKHRDFQTLIPYLISFLIWITPVFYPTTIVPSKFGFVMYANPLAGVLAAYRWVLLNDTIPDWQYIIAWLPVLVITYAGLRLFTKVERKIVDFV